jgi:hypothetical protein
MSRTARACEGVKNMIGPTEVEMANSTERCDRRRELATEDGGEAKAPSQKVQGHESEQRRHEDVQTAQVKVRCGAEGGVNDDTWPRHVFLQVLLRPARTRRSAPHSSWGF